LRDFLGVFFAGRLGTIDEAGKRPRFFKEPDMFSASTAPLARFAAIPVAATVPQGRSGLASFFLAPFRDVDDRPARKAAAARAEREARQAAMFSAAAQRR
jgi:hypothetical protein